MKGQMHVIASCEGEIHMIASCEGQIQVIASCERTNVNVIVSFEGAYA